MYASFFLHLFIIIYLYNSQEKNFLLILFSSLLLFLVVFFRHTYILNFLCLILITIFFNFFFKNKFNYEIKKISYFIIIISIFFIYLFIKGSFYNWFDQFLGFCLSNFLNIGYDTNVNVFSEIYKLLYYILRIIRHIIIPNSFGSNYFFSIIIFFNIYFLIDFTIKNFSNKSLTEKNKNKFLFS